MVSVVEYVLGLLTTRGALRRDDLRRRFMDTGGSAVVLGVVSQGVVYVSSTLRFLGVTADNPQADTASGEVGGLGDWNTFTVSILDETGWNVVWPVAAAGC